MSITPSKPALSVRRTRFTTRWEDVGGVRAQVVEVTLANLAPTSAFYSESIISPLEIDITGPGISTISAGRVNRLVTSDQVRVDVLVSVSQSSGNATVRIKDVDGNLLGSSDGWPATPLRLNWTADAAVLSTHETPTWVCDRRIGLPYLCC